MKSTPAAVGLAALVAMGLLGSAAAMEEGSMGCEQWEPTMLGKEDYFTPEDCMGFCKEDEEGLCEAGENQLCRCVDYMTGDNESKKNDEMMTGDKMCETCKPCEKKAMALKAEIKELAEMVAYYKQTYGEKDMGMDKDMDKDMDYGMCKEWRLTPAGEENELDSNECSEMCSMDKEFCSEMCECADGAVMPDKDMDKDMGMDKDMDKDMGMDKDMDYGMCKEWKLTPEGEENEFNANECGSMCSMDKELCPQLCECVGGMDVPTGDMDKDIGMDKKTGAGYGECMKWEATEQGMANEFDNGACNGFCAEDAARCQEEGWCRCAEMQ